MTPKPKYTFSVKLLRQGMLASLALFLFACIGIGWFYHYAKRTVLLEVEGELQQIAQMAAAFIDGELHQTLTSPSQIGSEAHRQALAPLIRLHRSVPEISYIYTAVLRKDGVHFILDTTTNAAELNLNRSVQPSAIMERYADPDPEMLFALRNAVPYNTKEFRKDAFGIFMSGYAPFFAHGKMVGIVGVDLAVADVEARLAIMRRGAWSGIGLMAGLSALLGIALGWIQARVRQTDEELRHQREHLEELVEARTQSLRNLSQAIEKMFETMHQGVIHRNCAGRITLLNPAAERILGKTIGDFKDAPLTDEKHPTLRENGTPLSPEDHPAAVSLHTRTAVRDMVLRVFNPKENAYRWINISAVPLFHEADKDHCEVYTIFDDITERKDAELQRLQTEVQSRHAQKMESIGQLAAGIAHEINTPIQYVGDNIQFLKDAFASFQSTLDHYAHLLQQVKAKACTNEHVAEVEAALIATDAEYLSTEIPAAIRQSQDGVERVTKIVRAMKEFSHPGTTEKISIDLNAAIDSTLTVCHNEWKYVANLVTEFDPCLPALHCIAGEINQVILNIVVNASHAIAAVVGNGEAGKGKITVSTRHVGDWAEIRISDTGSGIPEHARSRVFDPFFTTKGVGKGTGQGLAIAHSVIVEKHGGTITFETESGRGTTFIIRLPLDLA